METNTTTQHSTGECSEQSTNCGSNSSSTETEKTLESLYQQCRINTRYHGKRQKFFDNCHNTSVALSAILGTSSFALVLGSIECLSLISTALVGISSTLDLVFRFKSRADLHKNLKCKYLDLITEINNRNKTYVDLENDILAIEKDEPPTLRGIVAVCHNAQCRVVQDEESLLYIPWNVKWFKHFCAFDNWEPKRKSEVKGY